MSRKIDVFIVGAQKAGTTMLYNLLKQHPDICFSQPKEIFWFGENKALDKQELIGVKRAKKDIHRYFNNLKAKLLVEGSTTYFCDEKAACDIFEYNPKAKIVILLRNPIERLYSAYKFYAVNSLDLLPGVQDAFNQDYKGIRSYGEYDKGIKRFYKFFPKENVKVMLFDSLKSDNEKVLVDITDFLKINKEFKFNKEFRKDKKNRSFAYLPKKPWVYGLRFLLKVYRLFKVIYFYCGAKISGYNDFSRKIRRLYRIVPFFFYKIPEMDNTFKLILEDYYKKDIELIKKIKDNSLDVF